MGRNEPTPRMRRLGEVRPAGPTVALSSWTAFVAAVENGAYDR